MIPREAYLVILALVLRVQGDVYLHSPRGSNNRLNEQSANRQNANRAFDSQNNNRGGYNVGEINAQGNTQEQNQYRMQYFASANYETMENDAGKSFYTLEWTNQHGCGGSEDTDPHKLNCNIVIQYMCQPDANTPQGDDDTIRNGENTNTQNHQPRNNANENQNQAANRKNNNVQANRFLQEQWEAYDACYIRERNAGLFTADQKLKNNNQGYSSAIFTRQNPNGQRRGYECPEERDYYPYWHPTQWRDAAILVGDVSECEYYQAESFNVKEKYECVEYYTNNGQRKHASRYNNEADCTANDGEWLPFVNYLEKAPGNLNTEQACNAASGNGVTYVWGRPWNGQDEECLVALQAPDCQQAPWTRVNHNGNTRGGEASRYTMTLPYFPSQNTMRCAMRLRYNISTDDYDPWNTTSAQNQDTANNVQSPVQQNPYVNIGADNTPLRLAINTAQFGRVFQDRSHAFKVMPRPQTAEIQAAKIYNLNVRGKRGNIVQTYPAVEYDFMPNRLEITPEDMVHIQWTGSNRHNNNAPGGDGQTGDAGEGQGGTDRSNFVQMSNTMENYPTPFNDANSMFADAEVHWIYFTNNPSQVTPEDLAINMASSGYYECKNQNVCGAQSVQQKNEMNNLLNNAPPSYEGALIQFPAGEHKYMSTRNNNFSNRSQKGMLKVGAPTAA
ncbi:protein DD3-3-like [Lytechinus pictus]|uniref:protein DD3-3-like n=1 Tax=Lytechinus pictus TaxID=7653 RepID=UPI00240DE69A|nr:protein DD3-3-like [Lytechinus pictus]